MPGAGTPLDIDIEPYDIDREVRDRKEQRYDRKDALAAAREAHAALSHARGLLDRGARLGFSAQEHYMAAQLQSATADCAALAARIHTTLTTMEAS